MSTAWVVPEPRRTENEPKKASVVRETSPDLAKHACPASLPASSVAWSEINLRKLYFNLFFHARY